MTRERTRWHGRLAPFLVFAMVVSSLAVCSTGRVIGRGAKLGAVVGTGTALAITLAVRPEDGDERTGIVLGSAVGGA